jgi:hypothetical protein
LFINTRTIGSGWFNEDWPIEIKIEIGRVEFPKWHSTLESPGFTSRSQVTHLSGLVTWQLCFHIQLIEK